jgi:zinc D-Ala-D-Ala dipeptidase
MRHFLPSADRTHIRFRGAIAAIWSRKMRKLRGLVRAAACCMIAILPEAGISTPASLVAPELERIPAEPAGDMAALIGEYGSRDRLLTIYEENGQLLADGIDWNRAILRRLGPTRFTIESGGSRDTVVLAFQLDARHRSEAVTVGNTRLPAADIGRDVVETIRAGVRADPAALRVKALAATPPAEPPAKRVTDLVDLATLGSSIKFDIRYATSNNLMGFPLYEKPMAYLQRPAADALRRVANSLAPLGYGLLVLDAYRPWFVTKMFWDATPASSHMFVADPAEGSRHNRGCAIDLTLYDTTTGKEVQMTGRFDEMSPRSYPDFIGGTSRQRWLRDLLRNAMGSQGFQVYPQEWWHFDYQDWQDYALGNATFEQLEGKQAAAAPP